MNKLFEKFKGQDIPYLDWTFFNNEKEKENCKKSYSISNDCEIIGLDICGNILSIKDNFLITIDHEEPKPKNDYKITNEFDKLEMLLLKLVSIKDYVGIKDLDELKEIKKEIKQCKKLAPKSMKEDFQSIIDEIELEIEYL